MQPVIETKDLKKYFKVGSSSFLHAVDTVNLSIPAGATLGVVGESGCGKSTLGRTILGLHPATDGQVLYKGRDITHLKPAERKKLAREMQIIFQDPYSSINPRHSISHIIGEPIKVHKLVKGKAELEERVRELMNTVGLAPRLYDAYPHELDGGRRQRVGIARALGMAPEFIVCDEPVSALDVSIQAQILNLLMDLQEKMGLTYMFITHDLSVVKHISNEIAVMYLGQCVERAPSDELFKNPAHPYTRALLSAIPVPNASARERKPQLIRGEITSPIDPKPGCRFAVRCPHATESCTGEELHLTELSPGHFVMCRLHEN
ncbi:MAG: ATP-binding cassette domain-containing protein [Clostridia bacterium]|nr:ATP-binding cassette domain-containing protein [Clostridia bacterium]